MKRVVTLFAFGLGMVLPALAMAGTGGTAEFGTIYTTLQGWMQGTLGKVIALSALAVGLGMGVVRQSIMAVVLGIAMGLSAYYGPQILDNIIAVAGTSADAVTAFVGLVG